MRLSCDDGTLLLEDAPDTIPYAEWDDRVSDEHEEAAESTTTTRLTGDSKESYAEDTITVDWLLTRYNLALARTVLYDATEIRIRVRDSFATVFSYVKLFGSMHRIYPIDITARYRHS